MALTMDYLVVAACMLLATMSRTAFDIVLMCIV